MKINIVTENKVLDISNREKQLIHVATLNILALLKAIVTQRGMFQIL